MTELLTSEQIADFERRLEDEAFDEDKRIEWLEKEYPAYHNVNQQEADRLQKAIARSGDKQAYILGLKT